LIVGAGQNDGSVHRKAPRLQTIVQSRMATRLTITATGGVVAVAKVMLTALMLATIVLAKVMLATMVARYMAGVWCLLATTLVYPSVSLMTMDPLTVLTAVGLSAGL